MLRSIEAFVDKFHSRDPIHVDYTNDNDRLWVHDFIHTLVKASPNNARGEEITAIYQAVLLRNDQVSPRRGMHKDAGIDITLETIKQKVIPGVRDFAARLGRKYGFKTKPALNDSEIEEHFLKASILKDIFHEAKNKQFGEWTIAEIKATPAAVFRYYVDTMDKRYSQKYPQAGMSMQNF